LMVSDKHVQFSWLHVFFLPQEDMSHGN
jgi:hypothetical protein